MAYKFPLAAVLRMRELATDREEQALAAIHAALARLREALVCTEVQLGETIGARQQAFQTHALQAMHLHISYAAAAALRLRVEELRLEIHQLESMRLEQVARYEAAFQARELLSGLGERGRESWEALRDKRETSSLEDAFLARRLRAARLAQAP